MDLHPEIAMQCAALTEQAAADRIDRFAVGAAVFLDGRLLIVTRADTEDIFPLHLEIPGGGVDDGEDILAALGRELHEETGLIIKEVHMYAGTFDYTLADGKRVRQFNFLITPEYAEILLNPLEHCAYRWIASMDELDDCLMTPHMKTAVEEILVRRGDIF